MVRFAIIRLATFIPPLVLGGLAVCLERSVPLGWAALIYMLVVFCATAAGGLLLRSAAVGEMGWKNVLAGQLLPFSWVAGAGSLERLCLVNFVGTCLFGLTCFMAAGYLRYREYSLDRIGVWTIACWLAWVVLVGMVLFLIRQYLKGYYAGSSGRKTVLKLIAAPLSALVVSFASASAGWPLVGFLVAFIPIAIVFLPMAGILSVVVAAKLSGKPVRWN